MILTVTMMMTLHRASQPGSARPGQTKSCKTATKLQSCEEQHLVAVTSKRYNNWIKDQFSELGVDDCQF